MKKPQSITNADAINISMQLPIKIRTIFLMGCHTGLRISDILNVRVRDISNPMTIYESKSKRERTFKIDPGLFSQLKFLAAYRKPDDYVFYSDRREAKHINRSTVHRKIKKIDSACSVHSTRKLYAQNIFHDTGNIFAVQEAMNHKYVTTTATYLDIDLNKILGEIKP